MRITFRSDLHPVWRSFFFPLSLSSTLPTGSVTSCPCPGPSRSFFRFFVLSSLEIAPPTTSAVALPVSTPAETAVPAFAALSRAAWRKPKEKKQKHSRQLAQKVSADENTKNQIVIILYTERCLCRSSRHANFAAKTLTNSHIQYHTMLNESKNSQFDGHTEEL